MEGRKTTVRVGRATRVPDRILADAAYWNVPFLRRYLDRCDEIAVHEPRKAYNMAQPAVALADTRILIGRREGAYKSAKERRRYRVLARMVFASCAKDIAEYDEADGLYSGAFALAKKGVDSNTKARLHTSYAWFRVMRGEAESIAEADKALALEAETVTLAAALIARGAATYHFSEEDTGLEYFAHAATLAKTERTTKRGQRVFMAALQGLAKVLSDRYPMPAPQRQAYKLLDQVRSYLAGRPKSVAKMQVYRQMGRIAWNLGSHPHGIRLLAKARAGFRDLGDGFEFAICSLDLAGTYLESGNTEAYNALSDDTQTFLEKLDNSALIDALALWPKEVLATTRKIKAVQRAVEKARDEE